MQVRFKRFSTRARVPQKSTIGSACYDLFVARCIVLDPGATRSVETDIGFCFSDKYLAKIYPCPSVSLKSVFLGGGIVDSNYRRNLRVILHNLPKKTKKKKKKIELNLTLVIAMHRYFFRKKISKIC